LAAALAAVAAATTMAGPAFADAPTGTLSGLVRDTRGVVLTDTSVAVYLDPSSGPVQELRTDGRGRFSATDLKAGRYKIQIGLSGWSEWAPGRIADAERARDYRVTAKHDTFADSVVTAAGFITGRILGPDGRPAAGTDVFATNVATAAQHTGRTAADGTYRMGVQPGQTLVVSYAVAGFVQYVPHTFAVADATPYVVRSGRSIRVDDRAVALAGVAGRLTDAAGTPAGAVSVEVINVDTAQQLETLTRADGSYDAQVPPGRYTVRFTVSGRSQYAHQQLAYDAADVSTLTSGTTTTIDDQLLWIPAP
jgi:hypothetical protein